MPSLDPLEDGISSVELLASMGDDLSVVNAARVSLHKESKWVTSSFDGHIVGLNEADAKLIKYLAKNEHWTPFAHTMFSFRVKMPLFVARQWFRSTVGLARNEVSRRYVTEDPQFFIPKVWRQKPEGSIKQGSGEEFSTRDNFEFMLNWGSTIDHSLHSYKDALAKGMAPEMARMILPQSMYTEFIETGSLAAYARIANLRTDSHAQKEINVYADAVSKLIQPICPVSWDALTRKE